MYSHAVGSVTVALKGRDILRQNGIGSKIQRYTGEKQFGCGYVLLIDCDYQRCVSLLSSSGIKVLDVSKR